MDIEVDGVGEDVWQSWVRDWNWVLGAVSAKHCDHDVARLEISPPASDEIWERVTKAIGITPPRSFESVVRTRSARVAMHWALDGEDPLIGGVMMPTWGGRHRGDRTGLWCLEDHPALKDTYDNWIRVCWDQPMWDDNEYLRGYADAWYSKLPFIEVADGDLIAFDMSEGPHHGSVVYLCHDEYCEIHGKRLGDDFADFIAKWSRIGCVGPEGWEIEKFYADDQIQVDGERAAAWRAWLGDPDA